MDSPNWAAAKLIKIEGFASADGSDNSRSASSTKALNLPSKKCWAIGVLARRRSCSKVRPKNPQTPLTSQDTN